MVPDLPPAFVTIWNAPVTLLNGGPTCTSSASHPRAANMEESVEVVAHPSGSTSPELTRGIYTLKRVFHTLTMKLYTTWAVMLHEYACERNFKAHFWHGWK